MGWTKEWPYLMSIGMDQFCMAEVRTFWEYNRSKPWPSIVSSPTSIAIGASMMAASKIIISPVDVGNRMVMHCFAV